MITTTIENTNAERLTANGLDLMVSDLAKFPDDVIERGLRVWRQTAKPTGTGRRPIITLSEILECAGVPTGEDAVIAAATTEWLKISVNLKSCAGSHCGCGRLHVMSRLEAEYEKSASPRAWQAFLVMGGFVRLKASSPADIQWLKRDFIDAFKRYEQVEFMAGMMLPDAERKLLTELTEAKKI